jgi:2-dehydro-3-deoxyphosphogalactonate aldolase
MEVVAANSPYIGDKLHISMDPKPFDVKHQSSDSWKNRWRAESKQ